MQNQYRTKDFPKNLSIDVGAKLSFKNYQKIEDWYEDEIEFFQQIGIPNNITNIFIRQIKNQIENKFNQKRDENFSIEDLLLELKDHIESNFQSHGLISYKSKEGKWLLERHKINPSLTAGSFNYFQNKIKGTVNDQVTQRDGEFAAYLFDNDIEPNFEAEKKQYESFYSEIIKQKDELLKELLDIREENKKLNQTIEKQSSDWETTFTTQKENAAQRFNTEYSRHQSKMTESEEFMKKNWQLKMR